MASTFFPEWLPSCINAEHLHAPSILTEVGDLVYWDAATGTVKPASSLADTGTAVAQQTAFALVFLGLSNSQMRTTDTVARKASVYFDIVAEYPCDSATFALGDYVMAKYVTNVLADQAVVKTTTRALAIGRVVKYYASATTRVKVRFTSALLAGMLVS